MNRINKMEELLIQCEDDFKQLKKIHKKIKKIEKNRKELNAYYRNEYIKDYEEFANAKSNYKVLNQDSVWNVLSDQYNEKIKILKTIINSI